MALSYENIQEPRVLECEQIDGNVPNRPGDRDTDHTDCTVLFYCVSIQYMREREQLTLAAVHVQACTSLLLPLLAEWCEHFHDLPQMCA